MITIQGARSHRSQNTVERSIMSVGIDEIRRRNFKRLMDAHGLSIGETAQKLGKKQPYISAIAGKNAKEPIGKRLAREIEQAFGVPKDSLDTPMTERLGCDADLLGDVIAAAEHRLQQEGLSNKITARRKADMIIALYRLSDGKGNVDPDAVASIVRLLK